MDTTHLNKRYLVIVADDLGYSSSVNQAIAEAHDRGIVTAASLMAGGEAFHEAVNISLGRSHLSVGLHVTLCDGHSVLPPSQIPDLVAPDGYLKKSPIVAGLRYASPGILSQIEAEVEAQFNRLEEVGIHPTHVDGHHHLHMHPIIFEIICRQASRRGVRWVRLPRESLSAVFSVRFRGMIPFVEWAVFRLLGLYNIRKVRRYGLCISCHVYGLSRTGSIDEKYLLDVVKRANGSFNELFAHPDMATDRGRRELEALTSTRVRNQLACLGISLVGYKELSEMAMALDAAAGKS